MSLISRFITTRVRSTTRGYVFTGVCLLPGEGEGRGGGTSDQDMGTPPSPPQGQDKGRSTLPPLPWPGQGYSSLCPPLLARTGVSLPPLPTPPTPPDQDKDGCAARVVCLLCSRNRTFLLCKIVLFIWPHLINYRWSITEGVVIIWLSISDALQCDVFDRGYIAVHYHWWIQGEAPGTRYPAPSGPY